MQDSLANEPPLNCLLKPGNDLLDGVISDEDVERDAAHMENLFAQLTGTSSPSPPPPPPRGPPNSVRLLFKFYSYVQLLLASCSSRRHVQSAVNEQPTLPKLFFGCPFLSPPRFASQDASMSHLDLLPRSC